MNDTQLSLYVDTGYSPETISRILSSVPDNMIKEEYTKRNPEPIGRDYLKSSRAVKDYLQLKLKGLEGDREHFMIIFMDGQNCVIKIETLFTGSLTTSAVYPREVIKKVLKYEAATIILVHNHPSGLITPSNSDRAVTKKLQTACSSIDVEILDHLIMGGAEFFSFADHRLI